MHRWWPKIDSADFFPASNIWPSTPKSRTYRQVADKPDALTDARNRFKKGSWCIGVLIIGSIRVKEEAPLVFDCFAKPFSTCSERDIMV